MSSWTVVGDTILGGTGEVTGFYKGISLSDDGTYIAIGASKNSDSFLQSGIVRVYQFSGGTWTQVGSDIDGGENAFALFGANVHLSSDGQTVAIGASGQGTNVGEVKVYTYTGTWDLVGSDNEMIGGTGDSFGADIAMSSDGSIVAGGAYRANSNDGYVAVFEFGGVSWAQLGSDIDGTSSAGEYFGWAVDLSSAGTIVAIGGIRASSNTGVVRVYQYNGSNWSTQLGSDLVGDTAADEFGYSVALSNDGTVLAVGAEKGKYVRVFDYVGSAWVTRCTITGTDDFFGADVNLNNAGSVLAIGASQFAYVYNINSTPPALYGERLSGVSASRLAAELNGDGTYVAVGDALASNSRGETTIYFNSNVCFVHPERCTVLMANGASVMLNKLRPGHKISLFNGKVGTVKRVITKQTRCDVYEILSGVLGYGHRALWLTDEHIVRDNKSTLYRACDLPAAMTILSTNVVCTIAHILIHESSTALCCVNGIWCETGDLTRTHTSKRKELLAK